ncbi:hypothetical protein MCEMRE182_01333 [Candidatus Nanopelagicaceae bacterium]
MSSRRYSSHQHDEAAYYDDPIGEEVVPRKGKFKKLSALALILTAGFFIQSTLASNITLNSGGSTEFGQGVQLTTACSGSNALTVTPVLAFENGASANFKVSAIKVSGIPDSCQGADFTLKGFGETSSASLALFNTSSTDAVVYNNAGNFKVGTGGYGLTVTSGVREFTVNFASPVLLSTVLSRITIQSGPHIPVNCALGGTCALGDTGPGGGKVFYISVGGFACGPTLANTCNYMELAPYPWGGNADPTRTWADTAFRTLNVGSTGGDTASATAIGWGYRNTLAIIAQGNTDPALAAAPLARTYQPTVNGITYTDWFLPSQEEATQIYTNKAAAGLTYNSGFWTSTQDSASNARYVTNSNASPYWTSTGKGVNYQVRPIRAF